jgi:transcription antitermination factor NusG
MADPDLNREVLLYFPRATGCGIATLVYRRHLSPGVCTSCSHLHAPLLYPKRRPYDDVIPPVVLCTQKITCSLTGAMLTLECGLPGSQLLRRRSASTDRTSRVSGWDSEGEAMSSTEQVWQMPSPVPVGEAAQSKWYAVQTRSRHEKVVSERLQEQGLTTFLPLIAEVHRWSDRQKTVELPLFSSYVFVRMLADNEERLRVYRVNGVFGIVGVRGEGIPIPDDQIQAVRTLIAEQFPWSFHPFLKIGQRVRVRGGSMDGIEGVLVARNGDRTLVISIDAIQRSLAVRIEGYDVEAV